VFYITIKVKLLIFSVMTETQKHSTEVMLWGFILLTDAGFTVANLYLETVFQQVVLDCTSNVGFEISF